MLIPLEEYGRPMPFEDPERFIVLQGCGQALKALEPDVTLGSTIELDDTSVEVRESDNGLGAFADLGANALAGFASLVDASQELGQLFPNGASIRLFYKTDVERTHIVMGGLKPTEKASKGFVIWGLAHEDYPDQIKITLHPDNLHGKGYEYAPKLATPNFVVSAASYVVNLTTRAVKGY